MKYLLPVLLATAFMLSGCAWLSPLTPPPKGEVCDIPPEKTLPVITPAMLELPLYHIDPSHSDSYEWMDTINLIKQRDDQQQMTILEQRMLLQMVCD